MSDVEREWPMCSLRRGEAVGCTHGEEDKGKVLKAGKVGELKRANARGWPASAGQQKGQKHGRKSVASSEHVWQWPDLFWTRHSVPYLLWGAWALEGRR